MPECFKAFQDGVWNIWTVAADGNNPKRITSGTGNKRQPAWARNEAAIYFITGDRQGIWRLPVDPDGQPSGEASLWLEAPTRTRFGGDCLDFWEDRLALTIVELRSDLWLVEFPN